MPTRSQTYQECDLALGISIDAVNSPKPLLLDPWFELRNKLEFACKSILAVAIFACLAWFIPYDDLLDRSGTPIGGDFIMFYVSGQVFNDSSCAQLYDDAKNQQRALATLPTMDSHQSWPYRYPPTISILFSPLAKLPFSAAVAGFTLAQLLLLGAIAFAWRNELKRLSADSQWLWGCISAPAVIETVLGGQLSLLGLACATACILTMREKRFLLAGIALAISLYKPNVLYLLVIACLIARPRLLLGFLPTAALGLTITATCCGWNAIKDYVRLALSLGSSTWSLETPFWKVHGLTPIVQSIFPAHGRLLVVLAGVSIAVALGLLWRRYRLDDQLAMGIALACNSLFNPYVPIYDLVLLVAASFCLASYAIRKQLPITSLQTQWIIAVLFVGPHISQSLALPIGWQFFPLVLFGVLAWYLLKAWRGPVHGRQDAETKAGRASKLARPQLHTQQ